MKNFFIVNLGCPKNIVDGEYLTASLIDAGYIKQEKPQKADIIIVNSCAFIESAINESLEAVFEAFEYVKQGICKKLILVGCLPERFQNELKESLKEVDTFVGTAFFNQFPEIVKSKKKIWLKDPNLSLIHTYEKKREISTNFFAYLKISEGCNYNCTYCIIPKLKGKQRSREINDIKKEAENLIKQGFREIILVAQDTTNYGKDLNSNTNLTNLLKELASLNKKVWIKFLYGHPDNFDTSLIEVIKQNQNIAPYFDIPLQHISDSILKKMGRKPKKKEITMLLDKIRKDIPNGVIRTTFITGFPGETEKDFESLKQFIIEQKFNLLGTFTYSDFEDIPSSNLKNKVPLKKAKKRADEIMMLQKEISKEKNRQYLNQTLNILIEKKEKGIYRGRTIFQAPEIDGICFVHSQKELKLGNFYKVKITKTLEYDLIGKI